MFNNNIVKIHSWNLFFYSLIFFLIDFTIELKNTLQITIRKASIYCFAMVFISLTVIAFTVFPYFIFEIVSTSPIMLVRTFSVADMLDLTFEEY